MLFSKYLNIFGKCSLDSFGDNKSQRYSEVITSTSISSKADWANSPNKKTLKEIKQIKDVVIHLIIFSLILYLLINYYTA